VRQLLRGQGVQAGQRHEAEQRHEEGRRLEAGRGWKRSPQASRSEVWRPPGEQ
jgi:hypothetical protein